ncbi:MAG: 3-deoxy-D-manno-octulosonate 8-phosphate phosphatase, partial [Planctomycetota bacterium]
FEHYFLGVSDKVKVLDSLIHDLGISFEEVCYMGDDLMDIPVMQLVGFPVAVANAVDEVKNMAAYITRKNGGNGAVREVVELILKAQNRWLEVLELLKIHDLKETRKD